MTGGFNPNCQAGAFAELAKQEITMSIQLKFLSGIVRKADIAAYYPGGCLAFESRHLIGEEDDELYAIFSMRSGELMERIEAIKLDGFDTDRFVAIGDAWHGTIRHAEGIRFYVEWRDTIPATWYAESGEEDARD